MNLKKIIFYIFIILSIFIIYKIAFKNKINYVALGDSLAEGRNSYDEISYGYSDYLADYLDGFNKLNTYVNGYSKDKNKINNIIDDIENNRNISYNDKKINIRNILREANLVTLSVGIIDLLDGISIEDIKNKGLINQRVDEITLNFEKLIIELKKYSKNQIIVVGFYNPFPYLVDYKEDIDIMIKYLNKKYEEICKMNNVDFVDIFYSFDGRVDYLPNPLSINPNTFGYNAIFENVIKYIDI